MRKEKDNEEEGAGKRDWKGQRKNCNDRWKGVIKEKVGKNGKRTLFKSWYTLRLMLFHPEEPTKLCDWEGGK